MKADLTYLEDTVQDGHLCPCCREAFLQMHWTGSERPVAVCKACGERYKSFKELFTAVCQDLGWDDLEDAWQSWLKGHPEYEQADD